MKTCTKCRREFPETEFYVKDRVLGRLFSWCRSCHFLITKGRPPKRRNPDALPARRKPADVPDPIGRCRGCGIVKPRSEFPFHTCYCTACTSARDAVEAARASQKRYRERHPGRLKAQSKKYAEKHRVKRNAEARRRRAENPEHENGIQRRWKARNKDYVNACTHKRRCRILKVEGTYTVAEWRAIKAAQSYTCRMCGRREPEIKLTVDHIVPLTKGGRNDKSNLQGLCQSCNSRKHNRIL